MDKVELIKQADEMVSLHDGLSYECVENGIDFDGIYWLDHTYGGPHLCEDYKIKIHVPWTFPLFPPTIWETSGKIPVDGAFEHFLCDSDNALCLGASCDLFSLLEQNPTIAEFVDRVLPSYLYAAKYFYRYGIVPQYGERPHGLEGTIQAYKERYDARDDELFVELLSMLVEIKPYRGHLPCPCGSGHKLRDCHGKQLLADINSRYRNYYCYEAYEIIADYISKRKAEYENTRRFSKQLRRFAQVATICFWVNAGFAFLTLVTPDCVKSLLWGTQVILALAYVMLIVIDNCFLWYEAEIGRIKDNIADAFSANLTEDRTEGYYTNNEAPSIKKYAVNTYESAVYSREEAKAMMPYAIIKITVAIGMVMLLALFRAIDMSWVLWVAQTVFSSVVIIDCIQLIVFSFKMNAICKQFYTQLITEGGTATVDRDTILLSCVVEYETTKMYFKVRLSPKVFEKLKPKLEAKWAELLSQIK